MSTMYKLSWRSIAMARGFCRRPSDSPRRPQTKSGSPGGDVPGAQPETASTERHSSAADDTATRAIRPRDGEPINTIVDSLGRDKNTAAPFEGRRIGTMISVRSSAFRRSSALCVIQRRAADESSPVAELAKSFGVRRDCPKVWATSATAGIDSSAARLTPHFVLDRKKARRTIGEVDSRKAGVIIGAIKKQGAQIDGSDLSSANECLRIDDPSGITSLQSPPTGLLEDRAEPQCVVWLPDQLSLA